MKQGKFAANLKKCRVKAELSQRDLARLLEIGPSTLAMYETGRREPDHATTEKMASFFGVTIDYLLGREIEQIDLLHALENNELTITAGSSSLSQEQRLALLRALENPEAASTIIKLPILGTIHAGIPLLSEQNIIGHVSVPADMEGEADFTLIAYGDSMIGAGITEGDIIFCKEDCTPYSGQIVVALVNGDETTLKYYIKENGTDILRAANPEYQDIILKPGDQIQGRIVKVFKDPPPLNLYREYLYFKEEHLQEWNEVIETAVSLGIKPAQIKNLVEMQWEMMKRLVGK